MLALLGAFFVAIGLHRVRLGWRSRTLRMDAAAMLAGIALGLGFATATGSVNVLIGRYEARTPEKTLLGKDSLEIGASGQIRLELWRAGLGAAIASPLIGHGPESFVVTNGIYRDPDSPALEERPEWNLKPWQQSPAVKHRVLAKNVHVHR